VLFQAEGQCGSTKQAKFIPEPHENNVIDIEDFLYKFERLDLSGMLHKQLKALLNKIEHILDGKLGN
jgi:hypothetical protein